MKDDRLISLNAAIDVLRDRYYKYDRFAKIEELVWAIEALPPAQPDIVACGDCIHWICHDRRCGYWNHGVKPLDWCCHAERRSDG